MEALCASSFGIRRISFFAPPLGATVPGGIARQEKLDILVWYWLVKRG